MGGSIAHPDPHARRGALGAFLVALDGALRESAKGAGDASTAASLGEFGHLLRAIDTDAAAPAAPAPVNRLAVCRFWATGLRAATGGPGRLIETLETLGPSLSWTQNPNYRRRPPDATFLDNYGYAVIAGPPDGPPALAADLRLALGVLLLGPHAHYPLHAHPAVEIYYTLTPGEWWRGDGPWREQAPGAVIHHARNVPHATRAGAAPLLAIYLWRGDLATHAKLTSPAAPG